MTEITLNPVLDMTPVETDQGVRFRHNDDAICTWYGTQYRIPIDTLTDFTSVPRWLRLVVGQVGRHAAAATFHDAAYSGELLTLYGRGTSAPHWEPTTHSRRWADALFLDLMVVSGSARWRRWLIHAAVRLFGWRHYRNPLPKVVPNAQ